MWKTKRHKTCHNRKKKKLSGVTKSSLAIGMKKKNEILMNKPVYLGPAIVELTKILMHEFWYDFVTPKCGEKAKCCYMDTDSFIVWIKTDNIYKDIAEDVEPRFDTSNYELDRPLIKWKHNQVFGLMKDRLDGKIIKICWIKNKNL